MTKPKISVLMSCYNAVEFLNEAVESILEQSFTDFEFIIVDDGSKDHTLDLLEGYRTRDDRVKIVKKENTGLTDSLNVGLQQAQGEWVARLDADDIAMPDRLAQQYEIINNNSNIVLLGSGCLEIDQSGKTLRQHHYPTTHQGLLERLERLESFPHSSAFFNLECVRRLGAYRNRFVRSQDFDLWLRLSSVGELACVDAPLIKLRRHTGSISHNTGGQSQAFMGMVAAVCHFRRKKNFSDLADAEEPDWQHFLSWLEQELAEIEYFDTCSYWQTLKHYRDENMWYAFWLQLMRHPLRTARLIKGKVRPINLPSVLATKTIKVG